MERFLHYTTKQAGNGMQQFDGKLSIGSIQSFQKVQSGQTAVWSHAAYVLVDTPSYSEIDEAVIKYWREYSPYGYGEPEKNKKPKNIIQFEVGANKMTIEFRESSPGYFSGSDQSLVLNANFNLIKIAPEEQMNEDLRTIDGVEKFSAHFKSKYYATIQIGKLFDGKEVRRAVAAKFKEWMA